jgi:hypothetical protein
MMSRAALAFLTLITAAMVVGTIAYGVLRLYSESDDKGPSASLAPSTARSTYREYASRAAIGRRLAAEPFSSL